MSFSRTSIGSESFASSRCSRYAACLSSRKWRTPSSSKRASISRAMAGAFLDPAGEPDQRIPEVAFEFLARRLAFWNGEEESGRHSFLHFRCMTVGAGLDAADRQFSHGAAPGLRALAAGTLR